MLHAFLSANRLILIDRCRSKAVLRPAPLLNDAELEHGIPLFLDQLIETLRMEQLPAPMRSRKVSGPAGGGRPVRSEMDETATRHGLELWRQGYSVEQVVYGYGDLCQAITDLAFELDAPIQIDEFRTLNRCLDNAIAGAVTEFSYRRDELSADRAADAMHQRLGCLHELRNLVHTATLALSALRAGNVGLSGATGAVLDHSITGLRNLIELSVAEARRTAPMPARHERICVADLVAEAGTIAALEAEARGCDLTVCHVDPSLAIGADRDQLLSVLGNLLQNAFKFTRRHTEVALSAYAYADRVLIDVEDHCGGLPDSDVEGIFLPFKQSGADRSGLGLGLSICRRNVEANGGTLRVRDMPGAGCIFTIDLPRHASANVSPGGRLMESAKRASAQMVFNAHDKND
jgi:signal transduction histidine kinase